MSVGFEALPRQRGCAKWLVLLPCVFVPVYLCALVAGVCTHVCISVCVCVPHFHLYAEGCTLWLIMGVFMPVSNGSRTWF